MFAVPIYDTISVVIVRLIRRTPPWRGDRNHFAHRLIRLGMSEKVAVCFSYFVCLTLGLVALLSTQISTWLGMLLISLVAVSIMSIIAFLEYYSTKRTRIISELEKKYLRRRDDIRAKEDEEF